MELLAIRVLGAHQAGWIPCIKSRETLGGATAFSHKPTLIQADNLPSSQSKQVALEARKGRQVELLEVPAAAQLLYLIQVHNQARLVLNGCFSELVPSWKCPGVCQRNN